MQIEHAATVKIAKGGLCDSAPNFYSSAIHFLFLAMLADHSVNSINSNRCGVGSF